MRWAQINFHAPARMLRQFAVLWLFFFAGVALWQGAVAERPTAAQCFAAVAAVGGITGICRPTVLRPIFVCWMVLAFPIGWMVSHLLLAILFFGLLTPLGLIFKLFGRDALRLRAHPDGATYWLPKPAPADVHRYFRPF